MLRFDIEMMMMLHFPREDNCHFLSKSGKRDTESDFCLLVVLLCLTEFSTQDEKDI